MGYREGYAVIFCSACRDRLPSANGRQALPRARHRVCMLCGRVFRLNGNPFHQSGAFDYVPCSLEEAFGDRVRVVGCAWPSCSAMLRRLAGGGAGVAGAALAAAAAVAARAAVAIPAAVAVAAKPRAVPAVARRVRPPRAARCHGRSCPRLQHVRLRVVRRAGHVHGGLHAGVLNLPIKRRGLTPRVPA